MSNLIKSEKAATAARPHNALVLERETGRVHRVAREEDKAALEARIRHECETMYTKQIAEAYAAGFSNGVAEGIASGAEETAACQAALVRRSDELLRSFGELHERLRADAEETVIRLALEISARIVKREIELGSPVLAQIREALKRILGVEKVKIKIHNADQELVRSHKNELHQTADSVKEFVVDVDDKITEGGCILESELGNVDARLETQLKQIESALREHTKS